MNSDNWQARLGAHRDTKPRPFTPGQIEQYEDIAASLYHESSFPSILGSLEDLQRVNPEEHQKLMQLCRMAAMAEAGEIMGMIPVGASLDTYREMIKVLDHCMTSDPKFESKSLEEIGQDATKAAGEFKALCHRETVKPDGIIACALKMGLNQLHQPVTELVDAPRHR